MLLHRYPYGKHEIPTCGNHIAFAGKRPSGSTIRSIDDLASIVVCRYPLRFWYPLPSFTVNRQDFATIHYSLIPGIPFTVSHRPRLSYLTAAISTEAHTLWRSGFHQILKLPNRDYVTFAIKIGGRRNPSPSTDNTCYLDPWHRADHHYQHHSLRQHRQ